MLDELQRAIIEQISSVPLSQLRATLPAIKRQRPETVTALLDLCLIGHSDGTAWSNLVDYLITLLVCEEKDGRRYVAQDPTQVTPLMQKLCVISDRDKSNGTDALARMFTQARAQIERGEPAEPIIEQMRSAKHQALQTLLIPDLLRAIAVSNHKAELIETELTLEAAEFEAFEESLGSTPTEPPVDPKIPVVPFDCA
jgi:hypothetical protein